MSWDDNIRFPPAKLAVTGIWCPIHWEPILKSGERITVGIAVFSNEGNMAVPAPDLERLRFLYGPESEGVIELINSMLADLDRRAREWGQAAFSGVDQYFPNFFVGDFNEVSGSSINEVVETAFRASSSLLLPKKVDFQSERLSGKATVGSARLTQDIKRYVVNVNMRYSGFFDAKFRLEGLNRSVKIGYCGLRIVANFDTIIPARIQPSIRAAKASLWDLSIHRETKTEPKVASHVLFLLVPADEDQSVLAKQRKNVADAVEELKYEGAIRNIETSSFDATNKIGAAIVSREETEDVANSE